MRDWVTRMLEDPQAWEGIPRRLRTRFDRNGDQELSDIEKEELRQFLDDRVARSYRSRPGR